MRPTYTTHLFHCRHRKMPSLDDFTIGQPIDAVGRVGVLIDKRAHVRTDGTPTGILTWRVRCTHPDCTTEFEASTGINMSTQGVRKHCEAHRLTPAQYLAQGRAKRRENVRVQRAAKKQAKAAERERLAAPVMQFSRGALADKHREHIHNVREGARGATGVQGGGCGCN